MNALYQSNLVAAWLGILAGFVSGLVLGLFFHRDEWLGGYASFKRRLYRLGHISLFALAVANLCFYLTAREWEAMTWTTVAASRAFLAGAISMPVCCVLTAHWRQARFSFAVPVVALVLGATLTTLTVVRQKPVGLPERVGAQLSQVPQWKR